MVYCIVAKYTNIALCQHFISKPNLEIIIISILIRIT